MRFLFSLPDEGEYWLGVLVEGGGRLEEVEGISLGLVAEDVLESARFAVESSGPFDGVVKVAWLSAWQLDDLVVRFLGSLPSICSSSSMPANLLRSPGDKLDIREYWQSFELQSVCADQVMC